MAARVDWSSCDARDGRLSETQLCGYLQRIDLDPNEVLSCPRDLALLTRVVTAHACSICFEMYDVCLGVPVSLALHDVYDKLVLRRRGGYCLENNGLCAAALSALGFAPVRLRHARVWLRATEYTPENPPIARQHQVLVVRIGGRDFMVDVGFGGGSPSAPIELREQADVIILGERYRLKNGGLHEDTWILWGWRDLSWKRLFSFEHVGPEAPIVHAADFILCNHFVQVAAGTLFLTCRYSTRSLRGGGRVTIMRHELKETGPLNESIDEQPTRITALDSAEALADALRVHMGVVLAKEEARTLWEADNLLKASPSEAVNDQKNG